MKSNHNIWRHYVQWGLVKTAVFHQSAFHDPSPLDLVHADTSLVCRQQHAQLHMASILPFKWKSWTHAVVAQNASCHMVTLKYTLHASFTATNIGPFRKHGESMINNSRLSYYTDRQRRAVIYLKIPGACICLFCKTLCVYEALLCRLGHSGSYPS